MSHALSLQEIIRALHAFWAEQGCAIGHPHGEKVGAGTMNPATFLRVLGPEPWRVGYVEPSFRADDGRYAENPNRMQRHTQYQVILKPDPGHPQELYLASLSALGLPRAAHDVRFVEDNWESPALGAWGLGWEVWLDGQEITQFTYFQQAGGLALDPVSVEITYGLERIAMFLQGRNEVWSIDVDGRHSYADLYRTHEVEHSRYNFDVADVERLQALHALYQAEAEVCLQHGLTHLAHDYVLRQSHNFNLLDARGAIGVTERAQFFAAMRQQARAVAEQYVQERQRLEFPFGTAEPARRADKAARTAPARGRAEAPPGATEALLFEIGMEELPAHEVPRGLAQLRTLVPALLAEARLEHGAVDVAGTVRRFVVRVRDVALRQPDKVQERRGPSLRAAFHADGAPSKAALGFARSCRLSVDALERREGYLYARVTEKGQPALTVLPQVLVQILDSLRWAKTMRWNATGKAFPRPVRWLLALLGSAPIAFRWAGVAARSATRGPRYQEARRAETVQAPADQAIPSLPAYQAWLAEQGIVLDREARKAEVQRQVTAAAQALGGAIQADPGLLDEVTDLVEAPTVVTGSFPAQYLKLPAPVLITVMRKHQRYFPVCDAQDAATLLPHFITVVNGADLPAPEVIRAGNESVVNARFADAAFFLERDLATARDEMRAKLKSLVFHARLGSMGDKVARLTELTPRIGAQIGLEADARAVSRRAAQLAKLDLVTHMVVEMTSLQGIMMAHYARAQGEDEAVCAAVREHYQPRSAADAAPATGPGLALSLADRLDSLVGLMAVGVKPRGNADPFGLRRLGLGLLKGLLATDTSFDLAAGVAAAAAQFPFDITEEARQNVLSFLDRRLQGLMQDAGLPHDVVAAAMASPRADPVFRMGVARDLNAVREDRAWQALLPTYVRCARILPDAWDELPAAEPRYAHDVEAALHAQVTAALHRLDGAAPSVARFQQELQALKPLVDAFFDTVMILVEDADLRRQRLALVAAVHRCGRPLGDLTQLRSHDRPTRV